jgi:dolichol-phosphate mannosyltransferase
MKAAINHITVALPAYNEEKDLPSLLANLKSALAAQPLPWRIVICDDGSRDRTADVVREAALTMPVTLVQHEVNRGLGKAIETALTAAVKLGGAVITMDADNSHDPRYIQDMVRELDMGDVDLVICSRFVKGSKIVGVPVFRQALSIGCLLLMKILAPYRGVRDYSTGFRAYRAESLQQVIDANPAGLVETSGFACMLEILLKLRSEKVPAREISYTLRYDQKLGASKLRLFRTLRQYFCVIARFAWKLPVQVAEARPMAKSAHA